MYCQKCGAQVQGQFCGVCGNSATQQQPQQSFGNLAQPDMTSTHTSFVGDTTISSSHTTHSSPHTHPQKGRANTAMALGIIAMFVPIPILDVICGLIGLVIALRLSKDLGRLRLNALVATIIGTIIALIYTIMTLSGEFSIFDFL